MKINDFIFRYKTNAITNKAGICRVRLFLNYGDKALYAVLSELDENPSTSVTNAIELIVQSLRAAQKIPAEAIIIDHYPASSFGFGDEFEMVSFDAVGAPSWTPISAKKAHGMLACEETEFSNYRNDVRVQKEIYDAIKGIPKIQQFEYMEAPEITERRLEIEMHQCSLSEVKKQLDKNPSEIEIATFLKKDLSLIAENYAHPEEEYICFSEFPVGNGRVDFALFTGRSRMSVYLIEIKGANKPLRRKNHYGAWRAEIQEGYDQLTERAAWCKTHYEKFRKFTHQVLDAVKQGKRPYNAFVGPRHCLNVDPDKDIHISYVLIGGRTSDDLTDSHKRHIAEESAGIPFAAETWDSWFNKLTRD